MSEQNLYPHPDDKQGRLSDEEMRARAIAMKLPREPYTLIRVTWAHPVMDGASPILYLNAVSDWYNGTSYSPGVLARGITGYEILSSPTNIEARTVEGRDWVGDPDGTLVYWQEETDALRRRIGVLREEMDSNDMYTVQKSVVRRILNLPRRIEVVEP